MLKKTVKYTNYFDEPQEKVLYFNLTKSELAKSKFSNPDGLKKEINDAIANNDNETLWAIFESVILMAYGVVSADGDSFDKSEEISAKFRKTKAYDALVESLLANDGKAFQDFLIGILPSDMQESAKTELAKQQAKDSVNSTVTELTSN